MLSPRFQGVPANFVGTTIEKPFANFHGGDIILKVPPPYMLVTESSTSQIKRIEDVLDTFNDLAFKLGERVQDSYAKAVASASEEIIDFFLI